VRDAEAIDQKEESGIGSVSLVKGPLLGQAPDGPVHIDLQSLLVTKLLVQANSGAGKSWAIRRILEQTFGDVQHLVIDPEGEFSTLREKYDYVLAAPNGGDTCASPKTAKLLAHRLLELRASAILDIYELKSFERIAFVRRFLDALVDAPKSLWHPVLVVIDEAHLYCPQAGQAESWEAVVSLMQRGRKRGFCGILATQRLSKLHKDAAAECNNKLIGRSALDVDMKRAAEELGFTTRERQLELRRLAAGEFFAFGPALADEVRRVRVGPVVTTHPRSGGRGAFSPPPPTAQIRALLPKLADLPAEAEQDEKDLTHLRHENADLKRRLTLAEKVGAKPCAHGDEIRELNRLLHVAVADRNDALSWLRKLKEKIERAVAELPEIAHAIDPSTLKSPIVRGDVRPAPLVRPASRLAIVDPGRDELSGPEQRILDALAELEALGVDDPERVQVAFLAGYTNLASKGFANGLGALRTSGRVSYPRDGRLALTEEGRGLANAVDRPRTAYELHERILGLLGGVHGRVLKPLIEAHPKTIERDDLARAAGYTNTASKGFANAIGRLRSLGFIDYPERGHVRAADVLWP